MLDICYVLGVSYLLDVWCSMLGVCFMLCVSYLLDVWCLMFFVCWVFELGIYCYLNFISEGYHHIHQLKGSFIVIFEFIRC